MSDAFNHTFFLILPDDTCQLQVSEQEGSSLIFVTTLI